MAISSSYRFTSQGVFNELSLKLDPKLAMDVAKEVDNLQRQMAPSSYIDSYIKSMINYADASTSLSGYERRVLMSEAFTLNVDSGPSSIMPYNDISPILQDLKRRTLEDYAISERQKLETMSQRLAEAGTTIAELTKVLETIKKEPLVLQSVDRLSKDKKHCFVKKGNIDLRIEAVKDLVRGDEVLLHPKTFQIVERLGKPPLEQSPFAPEVMPNVQWADIGGLETAKMDLQEAIELPHKHKELFAFYGKRQIKGILLSGPPGCGKTMLGKAIATSLATIYDKEQVKTSFLYVKGPEVLNCYVGQTEQTIRDIFFDAKRHKQEHGYPAVVFIDEADAILSARGNRSVGIGATIVPMFLTEMDGLEEAGAIVILATNIPEALDPAVVRDGRIDRRVVVTRPTIENGQQILALNLAKVPLAEGLLLAEAAEKTAKAFYDKDRFIKAGLRLSDAASGAMLANCINIAVSYAIRRDLENGGQKGVTIDDLVTAVHRLQQQAAQLSHHFQGEQ